MDSQTLPLSVDDFLVQNNLDTLITALSGVHNMSALVSLLTGKCGNSLVKQGVIDWYKIDCFDWHIDRSCLCKILLG